MKRASKRVVVLAFLICFIAALFFSNAFVLTHSDHDHDHDGAGGSCATCAHIQSAENLLKLKQIGATAKNIPFAFADLFSATGALCAISYLFRLQTPIDLKVRMND